MLQLCCQPLLQHGITGNKRFDPLSFINGLDDAKYAHFHYICSISY